MPAPGWRRAGAGRRGRRRHPDRPPQPRVHRRREAHGACRTLGARRAARAAQADPRRRGLGGGSADAAAALARRSPPPRRRRRRRRRSPASRPRSDPTCPSACRAARRGCAGVARSSNRWTSAAGSPSCVAIPPFRLSTPSVYAAWDDLGGPAVDARAVPAPRRIAGLVAELRNDLEPAAEAVEPRLARVPRRARGRRRDAGVARGQWLGVRRAGGRRARAPGLVTKVRQRLRVPVVGTTSVSRGVRLDR